MRRIASVVLGTAVLVACASGSAGALSATTLTVKYWANGMGSVDARTWTLRCDPARGTLPRPEIACRRLAAGGGKLFAPIPPSAICTEVYGGPQVARIVGTVMDKRVWTTFTRHNGCHIYRWDRVSPWLLPAGGVTR